jgi:hypothetical protein
MIPCSSGSSAGETSFTPSVPSASLSDVNSWSSSSATATITIKPAPAPAANSAPTNTT